jgi:hypothetical protein
MPESPVPQIDGLPMALLQPGLWDRITGGPNMTPRQKQLLEMYETLDFTRRASLLHGMRSSDTIPGRKIEEAYHEQRRINMQRGGRIGSLRDTTESNLG